MVESTIEAKQVLQKMNLIFNEAHFLQADIELVDAQTFGWHTTTGVIS